MGYVAVKGGAEAIENAEKLMTWERIRGASPPLDVQQIREQLHLLVDRVMGEGALYAPDLAALAVKQSAGDVLEASFMLRAYRTTLSRLAYGLPQSTAEMRVIRRISAAFKEIPGGQILGPTPDYTMRLLDFELLDDSEEKKQQKLRDLFRGVDFSRIEPIPETFPGVIELLRKEGLVERTLHGADPSGNARDIPVDVTRQSLAFPAPRSAALQTMARGETGGLLLLAYSNMRGYGDVHPTIGELRVGFIPVRIRHPRTGEPYTAGEIKVTEAEVIARFTGSDGTPRFSLGYGLCFGHNETKAISMAVLDRAMQTEEPTMISENQEFVLSHTDGIESMGFCNHYKLPHYITFQSDLDRLRKAQKEAEARRKERER